MKQENCPQNNPKFISIEPSGICALKRMFMNCMDWVPIVVAMGLAWRRRWWRFIIGGINRPLIFVLLFFWNLGGHTVSAEDSYLGFLVPGLVVMAAVSSSYSDLVNWFVLRRTFYRVLDEYMLAPISYSSLLIGHVLGAASKGFVLALLLFLFVRIFVHGFFISLYFLVQLFVICLTFACLAVAVAMVAGSDKDTLMFTNLFISPMTFFCGTFFPVEQLPGLLLHLSWSLPLTAATYNLRSLALTGTGHVDWFLQSLGWLTGFCLMAYFLLKRKVNS
ncbi:ABC-type multidrug transport system, permease component [Thermoanaerobacter kivui]|uniref:Transport permease protein n=1 Tax=Thermoanaerobacter kivui TaxID=2325 RepID=A0A097APH2_THEKI|nr:ABC transporter permease [Thermoanaerobacter kivui]AIS51718.1 ABC-type multidrug transport system, permease component [Thermoanaerobacter kivui]